MRLIAALILAVLALAPAAHAYDIKTFVLSDGTKVGYVLVLPKDYDPAKKYEALLAFGGGDQTISKSEGTVQRFWEPQAPARGVIVVSPAGPTVGRPYYMGEGSISLVPDIVAAMRAEYSIKDGPIHLAGHSNGAVTAWRAAIRWPELFQSLTVIAGVPVERVDFSRIERVRGMKISAFVGVTDFDWKEPMNQVHQVLTDLGIPSTFTIVPRSGHPLEALSYEKSGPVFDTVVPAPSQ